jgi:hypothetical protein
MTPKEKAKQLVDKFQKQIFFEITDERLDIEEAKGCALIAVDEMLDFRNALYINEGSLAHQWLLDIKQQIELL